LYGTITSIDPLFYHHHHHGRGGKKSDDMNRENLPEITVVLISVFVCK
jgi:hypothetical protein